MIEIPAHGELPARRVPVIFPDLLVHADVAHAMELVVKSTLAPKTKLKVKTTSAGECRLDNVLCHGESESLGGLQSRERLDARCIEMYDYLHGLET
jgi:hypothetical protein